MDRFEKLRVFVVISFICLFLSIVFTGMRASHLERRVEVLEKAVKTSEPVTSDSLSVRTYRKGVRSNRFGSLNCLL